MYVFSGDVHIKCVPAVLPGQVSIGCSPDQQQAESRDEENEPYQQQVLTGKIQKALLE